MKKFTTNEVFFELFKNENCTQTEMGHRIELDKNSVHDWLKNKNELKFSNLEKIAKKLNKKLTIKLE
jgi:transcriptional regulator with XRE-family HTH domain